MHPTTIAAIRAAMAEAGFAGAYDALAESNATLVEALAEHDKTIKLCRSYASNTSGGMDAEARLRRIFELCC